MRREAGRLQAQCNALRVGAQKEEDEEDWEREGFTETGKNLIQTLLLLAGVLALLGAQLLQNLILRVFLGIFGRSIFTALFPGQAFSAGRKCRSGEAEEVPIFRSGKSN